MLHGADTTHRRHPLPVGLQTQLLESALGDDGVRGTGIQHEIERPLLIQHDRHHDAPQLIRPAGLGVEHYLNRFADDAGVGRRLRGVAAIDGATRQRGRHPDGCKPFRGHGDYPEVWAKPTPVGSAGIVSSRIGLADE